MVGKGRENGRAKRAMPTEAHPSEQVRSPGTPIRGDKTAAKMGHPLYGRDRHPLRGEDGVNGRLEKRRLQIIRRGV
jgi:hypothetical protein